MSPAASRYDYHFDPDGESTAAQVCRMVGHGRKVLELGCAAGAMSAVMKGFYQCRVTGVEYDAAAAESARPHCEEVIVASLESPGWSAPLQGRRFDTVVAADVLEHLRDPGACLDELKDLLTDDARLVVSVPNIAHSGVLAQLLQGQFEYTEIGLLDRTHVHFFTRESLGRLLHARGFTVTETATVDTGPWHPEFSSDWRALPGSLHDWLAGNPAGRAYQVLMLAHRNADPGPWQDDAAAQRRWLESFPSARTDSAGASQDPALETAGLLQQRDALQAELEQMRRSHSWRLTAPLRKIARLLK